MAADKRVFGLVLTGGESSRMGSDKASITYQKLPQWRAVAEMLRPLCSAVYWSCTGEQREKWNLGDQAILDQVPGHGPSSGLHAAFSRFPDVAWIVVGCDYPNIGPDDLEALLAGRSADCDVVTFSGDGGRNIEPMLSIWEPAAQRRFVADFAAGKDSPRRAILVTRWRWIPPRDPGILLNKNSK